MNPLLLIEDDQDLLTIYQSYLQKKGFETFSASNGQVALDLLEHQQIDLIITDVMMPKIDGIEFTNLLRKTGNNIPILMISAKETFNDKRLGFRAGVDDYMTKPVNLEEMLLRIEALLRRAKLSQSNELLVGNTLLNKNELTVSFNGEVMELPQKEFQILFHLLSHPKQIFTRQQLMASFWGLDSDSDERTIDVHIKRLRQHFINNHDFDILTVRGLGYKAVIQHAS